MSMLGELNFTHCSNDIKINTFEGCSILDIKIGEGLWLILTKNQAKSLKEKLEEVFKDE